MTDKPKRPKLLSAELEFEEITDSSHAGSPEPELFAEPEPTAPAAPPRPALLSPAVRYREKASNHSRDKKSERDTFTLYAALIALLGFLLIFAAIVYTRQAAQDEFTPSYLTLPQNVVTLEDTTIRMVVTVQVASSDGGWLADQKKNLSDLFPIAMTTIDVNDLNSEDGIERVRENLRVQLNTRLQTDKIQAVLINELLTRSM